MSNTETLQVILDEMKSLKGQPLTEANVEYFSYLVDDVRAIATDCQAKHDALAHLNKMVLYYKIALNWSESKDYSDICGESYTDMFNSLPLEKKRLWVANPKPKHFIHCDICMTGWHGGDNTISIKANHYYGSEYDCCMTTHEVCVTCFNKVFANARKLFEMTNLGEHELLGEEPKWEEVKNFTFPV